MHSTHHAHTKLDDLHDDQVCSRSTCQFNKRSVGVSHYFLNSIHSRLRIGTFQSHNIKFEHSQTQSQPEFQASGIYFLVTVTPPWSVCIHIYSIYTYILYIYIYTVYIHIYCIYTYILYIWACVL